MAKLSFTEVIEAVSKERTRQDEKWGKIDERNQTVAGFLLVLESELQEAKEGWVKNKRGKHSALSEIVQVAATAIACLEQYGCEGY